ncbi:MAG: D-alanyl-D-alanine carboxypeptidase, partial [Nitrospirae bacterium]
MIRRYIVLINVLLFFFSLFISCHAVEAAKNQNIKPYKSAILMEVDTGRILYKYNIHKRLPPASMTKMMLMLIVMDKVYSGEISLDDEVRVSAAASRIGGSQVYLKEGEVFTIRELMKAIAIHSANDACYAIAEYIAGTPEGFVALMNEYAKKLNMKDTEYHSVHGLPPSKGQKEDLTSAYDSAILAKRLIQYPEVLQWTSTKTAYFRNGTFKLENTNKLIGRFRGADGLKTGYYSKAGFNLTATAKRGDTRLIAVVMGAKSDRARVNESAKLLSLGFALYHKKVLLKKGSPYNKEIEVLEGDPDKIKPIAGSDLTVYVKDSELPKVVVSLKDVPLLKAPIKKGEKIGRFVATLEGEVIGSSYAICPEEVVKASFLKKLYR